MRYVQRRDGVIVGEFANPQPQEDGSCLTDEKPVQDDDKELLEFRAKQLEMSKTK